MQYIWKYNFSTLNENNIYSYAIQWTLVGFKRGNKATRTGMVIATPEDIHGTFNGFPRKHDIHFINFIKRSLHGNIGRLKEEIKEELSQE